MRGNGYFYGLERPKQKLKNQDFGRQKKGGLYTQVIVNILGSIQLLLAPSKI